MDHRKQLRRMTAEGALNAVQAVAIVIGGAWIMYQYLAHDRERSNLALQQQKLSTVQAEALATTQVASEMSRVRQLELANLQATIALGTQAEAQRLAIEQQRLTNRQADLTLQITNSQKELRHDELQKTIENLQHDINLKQAQTIKAELDVKTSQRYKFAPRFSISSGKDRDIDSNISEYAVKYSFDVENRSEVPFEMSMFILDYYTATTESDATQGLSVRRIAVPPNRWNPFSDTTGAVRWQKAGTYASIYSAARGRIQSPWDSVVSDAAFVSGAGGTGIVRPGLSVGSSDTYLVRAPKGAYIAFVMSYCLNRCENNDDLYFETDWTSLDHVDNEQPDINNDPASTPPATKNAKSGFPKGS